MLRRLTIAVALVAMAGAGITSASVLSAGPGAEAPQIEAEAARPGSERVGGAVADPRGGPPWAVRAYATTSGRRCIAVGRVAGRAFGPLTASGRVQDTAVSFSGSCATSDAEPLEVALSQYAAGAGSGARSVLFGFSDARVTSVTAVDPDGRRSAGLPAPGSFVVAREGLSPDGGWTITATMTDGSTRSYRR